MSFEKISACVSGIRKRNMVNMTMCPYLHCCIYKTPNEFSTKLIKPVIPTSPTRPYNATSADDQLDVFAVLTVGMNTLTNTTTAIVTAIIP